jgi:hypothetical protein
MSNFNEVQVMDNNAIAVDGSYHVNALGAGENRNDVNKQWATRSDEEKFVSLTDMLNKLKKRYNDCDDDVIKNKSMEVIAADDITKDNMYDLRVQINTKRIDKSFGMTHYGFNQLCTLANSPASYLRNSPGKLAAANLNWHLQHNRDVEEVGIFYDSNSMRAITGPTYGRIPDYEVVEAVTKIAGDGTGSNGYKWKVPGELDWSTMTYHPNKPITKQSTTLYASDRDVFIFLVDDRNPIEVGTYVDPRTGKQHPDLMFRGVIIKNSEVGAGTMGVSAFYLRGVCMNRNLWGVEGFEELNIRHSKNAPYRFISEATPALNSYASGDAKRLVDGVKKAKEAIIAKDEEKAIDFLRGLEGFSKSRAKSVINYVETEEGYKPRSAWDFAQGITAMARSIPHNDDRVKMEMVAKRILDKAAA